MMMMMTGELMEKFVNPFKIKQDDPILRNIANMEGAGIGTEGVIMKYPQARTLWEPQDKSVPISTLVIR